MKQTLYIHIGLPKTGSSFLQRILFDAGNRSQFRAKHVVPLLGFFSTDPAVEVEEIKKASAAEIRKALLDRMNEGGASYVISQESLSSLDETQISKLSEACRELNCRVMAYVRRQDRMVESHYKQWRSKEMRLEEWVDRYMSRPFAMMANLDRWAAAFGKENMIVNSHENAKSKGLEVDFFGHFGVDASMLNVGSGQVNVGLDKESLELLLMCKDLHKSIHDNRIMNVLKGMLSEKKGQGRLLSIDQQKKIMALHEDDNQKMAERYFGGDNSFFDPIDESTRIAPEVRPTLEDWAPKLMQVILEKENELTELKKANRDLQNSAAPGILSRIKNKLR